MNSLRPQRINRHRGNHRRVDAARKPQHHAGKAVLQHIVAKPQHAGLPRLFFLLGQAGNVAPCHRPAALATPPFGNGHRLFEHRHLQCKAPVGVEHERRAIEHQFILPANLIEIGKRQAAFRYPRHHEVKAHVILVLLER